MPPAFFNRFRKFFQIFCGQCERISRPLPRDVLSRNEWLYNNIPIYREAVDFTGKTDFKIKPSSRFHGEDFTGAFISPGFVKWSEQKPQGKKSDKQYQRSI